MRPESPVKKEHITANHCSLDSRLQILHGLPFYSMLKHSDIEEINKVYSDHGYQPGETIYFAGDRSTRFYVVALGKVKLVEHSAMGQNVLLELLGPGEFLGGSWSSQGASSVHSETAQAITEVCILEIDESDFKAIASKHGQVALKFLEIMDARMRLFKKRIKMYTTAPVDQRVAFAIHQLAEKLGEPFRGDILIQVPLSRADLAEFSGTTPETASRIVSQFKREGLIETGRQWMKVKDQDRLLLRADPDL